MYALFLIHFWKETMCHAPTVDRQMPLKPKWHILCLQVGKIVCVFRDCLGPVRPLIFNQSVLIDGCCCNVIHEVITLLILSLQILLSPCRFGNGGMLPTTGGNKKLL
jgi:hypothetical protein